ncbi:hypothetical protein P4518_14480 [Geobacillus thermodenitrificans]|uniref:hypothetical protein n=1 Tax=Geobacillus thermodenitrificans TaxID=33940 RepID=UPI002E1E10F0|nr:hypothetical protein [Geobacillus thermodenitrificans]
MTSNLKFGHQHQVFGDNCLATAMVDHTWFITPTSWFLRGEISPAERSFHSSVVLFFHLGTVNLKPVSLCIFSCTSMHVLLTKNTDQPYYQKSMSFKSHYVQIKRHISTFSDDTSN